MLLVHYTYVLKSRKTNRHYTGSCEDLVSRVLCHNQGGSKSTKHGIPWDLIYAEEHPDRAAAMEREKYFKTGKGRDELESKLKNGDHLSLIEEVTRAVAQLG